MYKKSKNVLLLKVFPRNTRDSTRFVLQTDRYESSQYKRSPYFIGAKLCDGLSVNDISLPDLYTLENVLKGLNRTC